jgi:hypothetical protein
MICHMISVYIHLFWKAPESATPLSKGHHQARGTTKQGAPPRKGHHQARGTTKQGAPPSKGHHQARGTMKTKEVSVFVLRFLVLYCSCLFVIKHVWKWPRCILVRSLLHLFVRGGDRRKPWHTHWTVWPMSTFDTNVLTSQRQSSTLDNWLTLASLLATSRQKWENTPHWSFFLALAELVRLFSCHPERCWL